MLTKRVLNHTCTKVSFVHQIPYGLLKRKKTISRRIFQGEMLSACETVCLWTLNFPLSKDTQFIYSVQEQEIPAVLCTEQILILWLFPWTQCRKQSCGDLLDDFWVCRSLATPFLSFLQLGKGQEESRHVVEEGTVAALPRSSNKGRDTTVGLKGPK